MIILRLFLKFRDLLKEKGQNIWICLHLSLLYIVTVFRMEIYNDFTLKTQFYLPLYDNFTVYLINTHIYIEWCCTLNKRINCVLRVLLILIIFIV